MKTTRCSVDECDRDGYARSMCRTHYDRVRAHGSPNLPPRPSAADRLASRLVEMPNGCMEWTGSTVRDYGRIGVNGKLMLTHRLAWELANGPIPDGLHVLHHCDNPPCAQTEPTDGYPDGHLFLGTDADNADDMVAKGRHNNGFSARTRCPQGHLYDEANTYVDSHGWRQCNTCRAARNHDRIRERLSSVEAA